jgi:hypothetical protein
LIGSGDPDLSARKPGMAGSVGVLVLPVADEVPTPGAAHLELHPFRVTYEAS